MKAKRKVTTAKDVRVTTKRTPTVRKVRPMIGGGGAGGGAGSAPRPRVTAARPTWTTLKLLSSPTSVLKTM